MAFFNSAIGVLQTLVIALGAGLGIWGVPNRIDSRKPTDETIDRLISIRYKGRLFGKFCCLFIPLTV